MQSLIGAPLNGVPILSFARDLWTDVPRCRHHVMSRLAPSSRVLFVSPPATQIRDVARKLRQGGLSQSGLTQVSPELFTFVPPPWLPYSNRPALNRALEGLRASYIRHLLDRLEMHQPILYVWHPAFIDMVERFDAPLVVYHCYDEYGAFRGANREEIEAQEARLLRQRRSRIHRVARPARAACPRQPEHIRRPQRRRRRLFRESARARAPSSHQTLRPFRGRLSAASRASCPSTSTRLSFAKCSEGARSGRSSSSVPKARRRCPAARTSQLLKAEPNVHFLGMKSFESLPSYLKAMDVCTIPYRVTGQHGTRRSAEALRVPGGG